MKQQIKGDLIEGLKLGLKAFIISYVISLVLGTIFTITILDEINDLVLGVYGESRGINLPVIMKTTSMIMHIAVFNSIGNLKIGILILGVIPAISFYISDKKDNKAEGFDMRLLGLYTISSAVYTLILALVGILSRGELVGVKIDYTSWRNVIVTFIVTLLLQVVIGMNIGETIIPGILASRRMVRLCFGMATLIGIIGLGMALLKVTSNIIIVLVGLIALLPNVAVYILFITMGISIELDGSLEKLMNFANLDVSFSGLPLQLQLGALLIFILILLYVIMRINKTNFLKELVGLAIIFPLVTFLAAFSTEINLGLIKNIVDVRLGINLLQAFLVPFLLILSIGVVVYLMRFISKTLKG